MARSFAHGRVRPEISGFQVTGGPVSKAGAMADAGSLGEIYGTLRKKSSSINEIPGLGLELGAKEYAADQYADMMGEKAEWDAKAIGAKYGAATGELKAKGDSAFGSGAFKFGASALMAALPLLSDRRVKHDIQELDNALEILRELRPVSFYYNEGYGTEPDRLHYGFIAQEYAEQMPDATYVDDDTKMLCINTMELIGLLVRANQQLEERLTRLEATQALVGAVR